MKPSVFSLTLKLTALTALAIVLFVVNLLCGTEKIPFQTIVEVLSGQFPVLHPSSFIVWQIRLPRAATAVLAGAALPVSGLVLQALFRNPIAGPDALGVSSGAGLGVAVLLFSQSTLGSAPQAGAWAMVGAGALGAVAVTLPVLAMAKSVRDPATMLILGLLLGAVAGALTMLLQYFGAQDALRRFSTWTAGGLGGLVWDDLWVLFWVVLPVLAATFFLAKPLDALLAGADYARSLGLPQGALRQIAAGASALLAGSVTAFCGPIAFVGIVVPHLARWALRNGQHRILFFGTMIIGVCLMLAVDTLSHLPGQATSLPINALTALVGVPITAWVLLRK